MGRSQRLRHRIQDTNQGKMTLPELIRIQQLCELDWELISVNTEYYTHSFHPYSSKYVPQIPNRIISSLSLKNELVLDNFVGSGTTLVESRLLGRNSIGIDINPLACLISSVKTTTISLSTIREISRFLLNLQSAILEYRKNVRLVGSEFVHAELTLDSKLNSNLKKWYHPNVICELHLIINNINAINDPYAKDFLKVAFSSLLRSVSNSKSGFGNLMINKQPAPKERIFERFSLATARMLRNANDFSKAASNSDVKVLNGDSRNISFIEDNSVDLICTHPPYMAAVPYVEYQRLSLWWLGYDLSYLEDNMIGGRRSRPDTPQRFFRDMNRALLEMKRVLRNKKYCCITIGNPTHRGKMWELNQIIKRYAVDAGFTFIKEIRRGKYHSTMGKMKEEFVLILRKE